MKYSILPQPFAVRIQERLIVLRQHCSYLRMTFRGLRVGVVCPFLDSLQLSVPSTMLSCSSSSGGWENEALDGEKPAASQPLQDGVVLGLALLPQVRVGDTSDSFPPWAELCNLGVALYSWLLPEEQLAAAARRTFAQIHLNVFIAAIPGSLCSRLLMP